MKTYLVSWGILAFLFVFVCAWILPDIIWAFLDRSVPAFHGWDPSAPIKLLGYIVLGLLAGGLTGVLHGVISPWKHKVVMVLPAVFVLLVFFASTLWIHGFWTDGELDIYGRWQFRYIHLPYHLPQMLSLVVGSLAGAIAGQGLKKLARGSVRPSSAGKTFEP